MRRASALLLSAVLGVACGGPTIGSAESEVGTRPERAWTPSRVKDGNLRIATFNIRNFPKDTMSAGDAGAAGDEAEADAGRLVRRQLETDEAMLLELLEKLDFDVLGVQEIHDPARLEGLLARLGARNGRTYAAAFSENARSSNPQRVGVIVRADRLRVVAPMEHPEIDVRGTLRSGFSARVESTREGGADFGVMVLHLASGDSGGRVKLRAEQSVEVAKAVAARQREWADRDFVVLGDMNTAKGEAELGGLDAAFGEGGTGLTRERSDLGCTSYHTKSAKNPVLEPAAIDHVYLASFEERDTSVPLAVGAHCAERACAPFESDSSETGTSYWGVSDHCPVYFEIRDEDRD